MDVFDENDANITDVKEKVKTQMTQTEEIKSLSCNSCVSKNVQLNPAVSSGIVSVFMPDEANINVSNKKKKRKIL